MPDFDQSVARHVIRFGSKDFTPLLTALTISCLLLSNESFSSCVHTNSLVGLSRCLSGFITSVFENAQATCSTRPNQLLMPEMSQGLGKSRIDFNRSLPGSTPSSVSSNPKNSSFFLQNTNLSGFIIIPAPPVRVRY